MQACSATADSSVTSLYLPLFLESYLQSQEWLAVVEHAWDNKHYINWKETSIIDQIRRSKELVLKEPHTLQANE